MLDRTEFTYETNNFKLCNLLSTSDAIRRDKSGSTLSRAMACCLLVLSHFLILDWPIINWFLYGTCPRPISQEVREISIRKGFKNALGEITRIFLRDHWVNRLFLVIAILVALLLTHYDQVTTHGDIKSGQHCLGLWLVSSRSHANTSTSDAFSPGKPCANRETSRWILVKPNKWNGQPIITLSIVSQFFVAVDALFIYFKIFFPSKGCRYRYLLGPVNYTQWALNIHVTITSKRCHDVVLVL